MRSQHSFAKKILPGLLALPCLMPLAAEAQLLPGILEDSLSKVVRPLLSRTGILNLLPERGKFVFPAPYNSQAVRITSAADCGGLDCVNYIGYSYWNNINNHVGFDSMLIFVGMDSRLGSDGPALFEYNKLTDQVTKLGPLFDESSHLSTSGGEGWYFSGTGPTTLYIPDLSSLLRYDVITRKMETVFKASEFGGGKYLWQMHSSADDRVHSATLRQNGSEEMLGCAVYREDTGQHLYYPRKGAFDECQIDKSGDWLVIKEDVDGRDGEDNRIININTGHERVLLDRDGAGGHSDLGHGYMVATDNWAAAANTIKVWDFNEPTLKGKIVYNNSDWNVSSPDHIAHGNASPNLPPEQQYACGSSVNRANSTGANEIICFGLDGSKRTVVVAPVMTDLNASGGGSDYGKSPKGNLDVTGQYFIWSSNMGGDRLDVFVAKVPNLLNMPGGGQDPNGGGDYGTPTSPTTPPPATPPKPAPAPAPKPVPPPVATPAPPAPTIPSTPGTNGWSQTALRWVDQINTSVNGGTLTKVGGCDGCADTGAASAQILDSGNAYLEFTVADNRQLHFVGLSKQQSNTQPDDMDFAFRLQGGGAEVRENGQYKADIAVNKGDKLRVTVEGGKARYSKNGTVIYTSATAPSYPLRAYASLMSGGSSVGSAVVGSDRSTVARSTDGSGGNAGNGGNSPAPAPAPRPPVTPPADGVTGGGSSGIWSALVNTRVDGNNLVKSGGCDGCADGRAQSTATITNGNGYLEFSVANASPLQFLGLSGDAPGSDPDAIDYALRVQAGYVEVRENGAYRSDVWLQRGDVLRIAVQNGKVSYLRNGKVFYTSASSTRSPLRSYATMLSEGSAIQNVRLVSGS